MKVFFKLTDLNKARNVWDRELKEVICETCGMTVKNLWRHQLFNLNVKCCGMGVPLIVANVEKINDLVG